MKRYYIIAKDTAEGLMYLCPSSNYSTNLNNAWLFSKKREAKAHLSNQTSGIYQLLSVYKL